MPDVASIARAIEDLTSNGIPIKWGADQLSAFRAEAFDHPGRNTCLLLSWL